MVNLRFAEKIDALKGHDFSRAASAAKSTGALAPEGWFSGIQLENGSFSAACLAADGMRVAENAIPQGLKPKSPIAHLAARLKPCPFKATAFAPTLIFFVLLISFPSLAQPAPQNSPHPFATNSYRIAGTIVNSTSGGPLRHATVAVLSEEDSHTIAAVESDDDGYFSFDRLPAAKYQLTASKRGFRTAFYDEHQEFNSAIVTGPGQETDKLTFRLIPGAILHGAVITEGGDPVEQARVMLFLKSRNGKPGGRTVLSGNTATDDTGAYDFSNLTAGEYLLAVVAEPWYAMHRSSARSRNQSTSEADTLGAADPAASLDVAYPVTYYDSSTDEASATRIVLAGGSRVEADITLHAVPALRIQVNTPRKEDGSIARAELRQTVFGTVVGAQSAGFLDSLQTGTTEFNGVAPGHYELAQGDPPHIVEMDATTSQQVDPSLGTPTVAVRGFLRTPAGAALADDCNLTLDPVEGSPNQNPIQGVCVRGAFTFPSVPAGQWQLSAEGAGKLLSVASIAMGSQVRPGNLITVADKPVSVVVAVSQSSTRLQGFARRDGKGVAGVMVVLVPRQMTALDALARRDQSDSDGSFSLRDVPPGDYTLVAIKDGWELDWAQPQVIGRYLPGGVAVTVTDSSGKLVALTRPVPVQDR
jgi:Carboxypeptidase regulatory-like domain